MRYVLINDEGLDLGVEALAAETLEVEAHTPQGAVEKIVGTDRRLFISKFGKAPGVWLVRDDDKEAFGLSLIVVERADS